jgi:N-acetylglucosaminyldiphosphoundecaprenol N-acetyl-beta-D-mannosaminyltransferase
MRKNTDKSEKMPEFRDFIPVSIASTTKSRVINDIADWLSLGTEKRTGQAKFIVTAYSESILELRTNKKFSDAVGRAHLVVPDGVSVAASVEYLAGITGSWIRDFVSGLSLGRDILAGKFKDKVVTGVGLFEDLIPLSAQKGWKVLLVGGWSNSAARCRDKLKLMHPGLNIQSIPGPMDINSVSRTEEAELVSKINKFAPHLLFISFGRFRQEIWTANNLDGIRAGVVIGVGSAFDEISQSNGWKPTPAWVSRMGLKWAWRVVWNPKHIGRAIRAVIIFPLEIFLNSRK